MAEQSPTAAMLNWMRCRTTLLAFVFGAALVSPCAAQMVSDTVATGFRSPLAVVADPTSSTTLVVVEQDGLIRVVHEGIVLTEPFLDLRNAISSGGERGLLGLAFAPDYTESRRFFVNFTDRSGDTVIARFLRHIENPFAADMTTRFDLLWPTGRRSIDQPFSNHNGGHLAFGPDGYLYVGLGDGGSGGDPMNHAQNPQSLLGKMLRLDVNVPDADLRGYRVPADNPFVDGDPVRALPEIWAFGLRNPWRYSFDDWTRGGTSALTIGDVGQNAREELNFEPAGRGGRNYGWRLREGRRPYDERTPAAFGPLIEPMHDYDRTLGASVTGGLVYRGAALDPMFNGRYFFADFISGRVFSIGLHLHPLTTEATADDEREHSASLGGRDALGMISSFGTDQDGEMLLVNYAAGRILRVVPDYSMVPRSPRISAEIDGDIVRIAWEPAAEGVSADSYFLERVRNGAVVERQFVNATHAELILTADECLRVRAVARGGLSGPASAPVCPSQSP